MTEKTLLTKQQLSDYLGLSVHQVARLTAARQIPFVKFSERAYRYDLDMINSWIKDKTVNPLGVIPELR